MANDKLKNMDSNDELKTLVSKIARVIISMIKLKFKTLILLIF